MVDPARRVAVLTLAVAGAASAWGLVNAWSRLDEANVLRNPLAAAMLALGCASALLLVLAVRRLRAGAPVPGALLRWTFVSAVLLWFGYVAAAGDYYRGRVGCVAASWSSCVALAAWRLPGKGRRPRRWSLLLLALAIALLAGELALRAAAALQPGPLFTRSTATSAQRIAAYRFAPGHEHFGFKTNRLGCYDDEFAPPSPSRRPSVAVIGDSFSASFVPHAFHYTTVAERELGDVDLWNVGWPALGPAEYRVLLQDQVLPLRPEAVIVSIFLGNDLAETSPWSALDRSLADWFDRGNVLLCEVPRRLLVIARGVAADAGGHVQYGDLALAQAWLHDPLREPGTFAPAEFLRLEVDRARVAGAVDERRWGAFAQELLALRALAGDRPFGFALIPDEFMVEDALWQRVQQAAGVPLERHALRERIVGFCAGHHIPCLDLWPALTAVPALPDGDRHLYLLRDTHWNVRGNQVAGVALAPFVRALLRRPN